MQRGRAAGEVRMARITAKENEVIQRALGIMEGVACGCSPDVSSMLITAVEMIDGVLNGGSEDG